LNSLGLKAVLGHIPSSLYCYSVYCGVAEELKDAIQNDIKIAEAKLDLPSFSKHSKDDFFIL